MYKMKADDLLPIAGWCIAIPALQAKEPVKQPNIVIILADDLGFGDLYSSEGALSLIHI